MDYVSSPGGKGFRWNQSSWNLPGSLAIPQLLNFTAVNFSSSSFGLIRADHDTQLSCSDIQFTAEGTEPGSRRRKRGTTYRVPFTGQTSSDSQSKKTPTCFWTSCSKAAFSWMDQYSSVLKALLEWANGIFILHWVNISLHCSVYTHRGLRFFF